MKELDYFSNRRSVRNFAERAVSDELLRSIVERAMRAPTTGNMQLYSVIASRKGAARKELEALHFNQPASVNADVLLTVCADIDRFERWCRVSGADPGYDNLLTLTSAMLDATIFSQQIVTIAEQEGLGTVYLGTVTYNAPEIASLLELPAHVVPVCCLAIGWPSDSGVASERLGVEAVLSFDKYPVRSDEDIRELYRAKDEYAENAKFVKENQKDTLAQVFTDIRYPRSLNEEVSAKLQDYLKNIGLM